jgi:hypothetical protein
LTLLCANAFSQLSTPAETGSTNCFSDSELAAFEAEVQAEVERATLAGVSAAIAPLYAQIAEDQKRIDRLSRQRYLFVGTTFITTFGLAAALYVLSTLVKPIAP